MTASVRLRLRAEDEADLQVLAACLQDALVPLADMIWLRDQCRFAMVVNRFMWEVPPERVEDEAGAPREVYSRTHGILSIRKVRAVQLRGIDQRDRDRILELLTIRPEADCLYLEFAGGGCMRVTVDAIDCALEDVGAPWPTGWRPSHPEDAPSGGAS